METERRAERERKQAVSTDEINAQVNAKLDAVRAALAREITGTPDVCLTCSFQAEDVLLTKLAIELDAKIPILFLDTGYHFAETYAYRDRIAREWNLNLVNLLPEKSRHMLNYRILGFAWNEIGRALLMSEKQAKTRFYYALNKVRAKLRDSRGKGAGHSEESD